MPDAAGPGNVPQPASRAVELQTVDLADLEPVRARPGGGDDAGPHRTQDESFENAPDLYGLAARAVKSNDRRELLHAISAMGVCIGADVHQQQVGHLLNAAPADAQEREVARVATLLLTRCRGFIHNDLAAIMALRRDAYARLRELGGFVPGTEDEMTPADFKEIVDRRDWLLFEYAFGLVSQARVKERSPTVDDALFGIALMAAACSLGKECGPESITYAAQCLRTRECPGSWEKSFGKGLDPQQTAKVAEYRGAILRAVDEKNYAYFGLAQ